MSSFAVETQPMRVDPGQLRPQGSDFAVDTELSSLRTSDQASEGLTLTVKPSEGVTAGQYGIGLPQSGSSASGVLAVNGSVVYTDLAGGASSVVQSTGANGRVSAIVSSIPTTLTYKLVLPEGVSARVNTLSGVDFIAADGAYLAGVTRPTAMDANGQLVPSRLRMDGGTMILGLDPAQSGVAFPVVATFDLGSFPREAMTPESSLMTAASALAACTAFAAGNAQGEWTCDGHVLTESDSTDGASISDIDTGATVALEDVDTLTAAEAGSVDALMAQAYEGPTSASQPAVAAAMTNDDVTLQARVDDYHANYESTFFYGKGNAAKGNLKFTHQVSIYNHSARDNMTLKFTEKGSDLYWNMRIRRDNSWAHDDTVFNYPYQRSCQAGAGLKTCSTLEHQYGDGYNKFPYDGKKYYIEAYGWDFYAGGCPYGFGQAGWGW